MIIIVIVIRNVGVSSTEYNYSSVTDKYVKVINNTTTNNNIIIIIINSLNDNNCYLRLVKKIISF